MQFGQEPLRYALSAELRQRRYLEQLRFICRDPSQREPRDSSAALLGNEDIQRLLSSDSSVSAVQLPWKHSCSIAFICTNRLSVGFIPASALLCVGGERYGKLYCALHFLGEYLRCLVRLRLRSLNDQLIMHL